MFAIFVCSICVAFLAQCSYSTNTISVPAVFDQPLLANPSEDPKVTRQKAAVRAFAGNVRSYSGFLSVDPKYDANLFYWFFECQSNPIKAPLMLWLYGEIGRSSMLSVFEENGAYKFCKDTGKVILREQSWTRNFNMLYLDSTVATGYSTANNTAAYPRTTRQAACHLYKALKEFLRIYDEYEKAPLYVAGESHVAKIVLSLANLIHEEKAAANVKINLKRVSIGAGIIDPVNQQKRSEFLYQLGVVDHLAKFEVIAHEEEAQKAIADRKYAKANRHNKAVEKQIKMAGYWPALDALEPKCNLSSFAKTVDFYQSNDVRKDLHAANKKFEDKPAKVLKYIRNDLLTSSSKELVQVLRNYQVMMYTGQYDIVVPTSQYDKVIERLPWNNKGGFVSTPRQNWIVNGKLAGYYKYNFNLFQFMIRQANHFVARSQPEWTLQALKFAT